MKIILITHPIYAPFFSIHMYTEMLREKCEETGYEVEIWQAKNYEDKKEVTKLTNYYYQFIFFPNEIKKRLKKEDFSNTLFVLTDQSLGYLVPLFRHFPHVVHCHDFLAQKSALGEIPENKVKIPGKFYQALIRRGFRKAKNFISISKATQEDLHRFLGRTPKISEVVYNGLNQDFSPKYKNDQFFREIKTEFLNSDSHSYLLHVGGDHFYKNREGVLRLYLELKNKYSYQGDLIMVGPSNNKLDVIKENAQHKKSIHIIQGVATNKLKKLYSNADAFLFPSLEEGFGWPIAEAMASGCPVITTNKAPMTEVGSDAAIYIDRLNALNGGRSDDKEWLVSSGKIIMDFLKDESFKNRIIMKGLENAKRFDSDQSFMQINNIYKKIIDRC